VKIVTYQPVSIPSRIIPLTTISEYTGELSILYQKLKSDLSSELDLSADISEYFNKLREPKQDASPYYIKINKNRDQQTSSIFKTILFFFKNPKLYNDSNLRIVFKGIDLLYKQKHKTVEKSKRFPFFPYLLILLKKRIMQHKLKKAYLQKTQIPDLNSKYIYFGLHYQPEATTMPIGGIFNDQILAIRHLASIIPDGWKIYVKENFYQFVNYSHGHLGRISQIYQELCSIKNVILVPTDFSSFQLLENAQAVSTITGTVGLEAMVRAKPVIIFGLSWIQDFEGVLKIQNTKDVEKIMNFIQTYKFNKHNVDCYLKAFDLSSVYAYHYPGKKLRFNMDEKLCVENLTQSVINLFSHST
jgi:hypothetical protein